MTWSDSEIEIVTKDRFEAQTDPCKFFSLLLVLLAVHFVVLIHFGTVMGIVIPGVIWLGAALRRRCNKGGRGRNCKVSCAVFDLPSHQPQYQQQYLQHQQQQQKQQQEQQQKKQQVLYAEQLRVLFDLGFTDVLRNVDALKVANGDVNLAVQALLNNKKDN